MKITNMVEKSLLKALERANRPLNQVDLLSICDNNMELFGEPGSLQRRNVQEHFNNLKRRSARNYKRTLSRYKIAPSLATKAWLEAEARMPSPTNSPLVSSESGSSGGGDGGGAFNGGRGNSNNLDQLFATMSLQQEPGTGQAFPPSSPPVHQSTNNVSFAFPPHQTMAGPKTNGAPPNTFLSPLNNSSNTPRFGNGNGVANGGTTPPPAASVPRTPNQFLGSPAGSYNSIGGSHAGSSLQDLSQAPGSRLKPHDVPVDLMRPEQHGRFDVIVNPERQNEAGTMAAMTLHIKTPIGPPDEGLWHAFMDRDDQENPNRSFIIQGPARDSWLRNAKDRDLPEGVKSQIGNADSSADSAIASDPLRNTVYWKFTAPEGWELDNMFLSSSHDRIEHIKNGTTEVEEGVAFHTVWLEWEIAKAGTVRELAKSKSSTKKNGGLKNLFRK